MDNDDIELVPVDFRKGVGKHKWERHDHVDRKRFASYTPEGKRLKTSKKFGKTRRSPRRASRLSD